MFLALRCGGVWRCGVERVDGIRRMLVASCFPCIRNESAAHQSRSSFVRSMSVVVCPVQSGI